MIKNSKINSFIIIDFETGGIDKSNGLHCQKYAATEVAAMAIDGVTLQEIVKYDNLIKPYDNNLIYDAQASQITGIDKELCEKEGVPLRQVVDDLCIVFQEANVNNSKTAKPIFVAHNWNFDRGFLMDIFRRADKDLSDYVSGAKDCYGNFIPSAIDTIDLAKQCWGEVFDSSIKFNLNACCHRAEIDHVDGHRAMNDVIPTADLFKFFIRKLRSNNAVSINQNNHRKNFQW